MPGYSRASGGRGGTIKRQWALLKLLKAGGGTIAELADLLGVHDKTVRRDLDILQDVGFPVYNEDEDEDENKKRPLYGGVWRMVDRKIV